MFTVMLQLLTGEERKKKNEKKRTICGETKMSWREDVRSGSKKEGKYEGVNAQETAVQCM